MKTLEQATGHLRPDQLVAIDMVCKAAQGMEHVDELAFVSQLLVELMSEHEQTPVGWAIVTAHKALLKMAANERIITEAPRVRHPRRRESVATQLATAQSNAAALDHALVELRRNTDREVFALRVETQGLREELAKKDIALAKKDEEIAVLEHDIQCVEDAVR